MKTVRDYGVAKRTALVIALLFLFTCAKSPKASQTSKPSEIPEEENHEHVRSQTRRLEFVF